MLERMADQQEAPTGRPAVPGLRRAPAAVVVDSPCVEALRVVVAANPTTKDAQLERFWAAVAERGAPLLEPADSPEECVVTFLWRGTAETDGVLALVNRVTDRRDLAASALRHLAGTDVWHLSYRMPADWQASYQLAPNTPPLPAGTPVRHGTAAGPNRAGAEDLRRQQDEHLLAQARPDPLNHQRLASIWGGPGMSAVYAPGAPRAPEWTPRAEQPPLPRGAVRRHAFDDDRAVWVYEPAAAAATYDLLLLLDGQSWAEVVDVAAALDQLVATDLVRPLLVVMPEAAVGPDRTAEFACNPRFTELVVDRWLPWIEQRWPIAPDPARRAVAGQSMGGLAAVWLATRVPERIGVALAQSGSFWWRSHQPDDPDAEWLTHRLAEEPAVPVQVHLAVGLRESLLTGPTRRLAEVLRERGHHVRYDEYCGGHDMLWWRTALTAGLQRAFAPATSDHDGAA